MGCTGRPRPATIPADWQEYSGWACTCPIFVPGTSATRPPPLVWGDCDFPLAGGIPCRRLVGPNKGQTGIYSQLSLRPSDGKPLLQTVVAAPEMGSNARHSLVAEVDGEVLVDYLQVNPPSGCRLVEQALSGDHYLFLVPRDSWDAPSNGAAIQEGFLAGTIDQPLPTRVMKYPQDPSLHANWSISEEWIVQLLDRHTAFPWQGEGSQVVYDGAHDPDGLPGHQTLVRGKNVFVEAGGLSEGEESVWTPAGGQQVLIGWPGDATQSAGNFGTDGTNLVWTHAQGGDGSGNWGQLSVMTAPFTTDPATRAKTQRRLRKDLKAFDTSTWVTGCGYAARQESLSGFANGLVVVRLSDGVGWTIPGGAVGSANFYSFDQVIGVTCDEIFTNFVTPKSEITIVRLRLDSLGTPLPPD
jgi:hypothetical protein